MISSGPLGRSKEIKAATPSTGLAGRNAGKIGERFCRFKRAGVVRQPWLVYALRGQAANPGA